MGTPALQSKPTPVMTREEWINGIAAALAPRFEAIGKPLPAKVRFTLSLINRKKVVGLCFPPAASTDEAHEILIRIDQDDPLTVAGIVAHEMAHAAVGNEHGHKAPFKRVVRALGLEGKPTATVPGPVFAEFIRPTLAQLGPMPHGALNPLSGKLKKQGTRLLKVHCRGDEEVACGFVVRQTKKWVDEVGPAHCPKHGEMVVEGADEDEDNEGED